MTDKIKAVSEAASRIKTAGRTILIAIDGRCAAGKTTLAYALQRELDCTVFHMDSFFPRPEQRTPERFAKAGENVDHERFLDEVLKPLSEGKKKVIYRSFDCGTMSLSEPVSFDVKSICVTEGSYACHDRLWEYYDLQVLLDVDEEEQIRRIIKRNGVEKAKVFKEKWIPLEERYFAECGIEKRCEMKFNGS